MRNLEELLERAESSGLAVPGVHIAAEMASRLRAVAEIHREYRGACPHCTAIARFNPMDKDVVEWPCATRRALDGEEK